MSGIPDGFGPHPRKSKFTDPWEPLYSRRSDAQWSLGTVLRDVHCNSRGLVHGGFIATLADNAMGLSAALALGAKSIPFKGLVTVNLSVDYVGQARVGDWIETDSRIVRAGRSLAFVETRLISKGKTVARANATFKVVAE